jgi:hypothetical protein
MSAWLFLSGVTVELSVARQGHGAVSESSLPVSLSDRDLGEPNEEADC